MDHLTHLVTFVRVVQSGSFAGAAQRLQLAPSVASKHVSRLEKHLGARLLHRSTRKLSLTEAGASYYEHCLRILDELEQAQQVVAQLQGDPRGRLRVSTVPSFTSFVLAPLLPDFLHRYPQISLEFVASERIVDLADEGFDLALRITREPAAHLVARRLAPIQFIACASPQYLERHGRPLKPSDLAGHNCLGYPSTMAAPLWRFQEDGRDIEIAVQNSLEVNSVDALRTMALAGAGIASLPSYAIGKDLRAGRLVSVLDEHSVADRIALYAVYLPNRFGSPKLRAFVNFLVERIGSVPWWDLERAKPEPAPATPDASRAA